MQDLNTPVLFLVFSRLDTTKQVFDVIRQAKPPRLYVAADGARAHKPDENLKVEAVRNYILENIDWGCEVKTLFRQENLGCRCAVSSAIDWFFKHEEEGIILEDDTVPDLSFFDFCEELLYRYKDDERVMSIVAPNIRKNIPEVMDYSYFFSRYSLIWGWATWRRAWQHYDRDMTLWPKLRNTDWLLTIGDGDPIFKEYWERNFDRVYSGKLSSWGFVWILSCWAQNGLSILPTNNLIQNVGFGLEATHTKFEQTVLSNLRREVIKFPLNHPPVVSRIYDVEKYIDRHWFGISRLNSVKRNIRKSLPKFVNN